MQNAKNYKIHCTESNMSSLMERLTLRLLCKILTLIFHQKTKFMLKIKLMQQESQNPIQLELQQYANLCITKTVRMREQKKYEIKISTECNWTSSYSKRMPNVRLTVFS